MNFGIVELVKEMEYKDLELQFILQCAPVIAGLKISNLLTLPINELGKLRILLEDTSLSFRTVFAGEKRAAVLVYRKEELFNYLSEDEISSFLTELGYKSLNRSEMFPVFIRRYIKYMRDKKKFPHELGILLGYPIEDVKGFMENEGRDFLYCGYWKIYKNPEPKIKLFERFEKVQTDMVRLLHGGKSVSFIIKRYSNTYCGEEDFEYSDSAVCA